MPCCLLTKCILFMFLAEITFGEGTYTVNEESGVVTVEVFRQTSLDKAISVGKSKQLFYEYPGG